MNEKVASDSLSFTNLSSLYQWGVDFIVKQKKQKEFSRYYNCCRIIDLCKIGSGESSLAFDTIYAEGQRRYIETFSAYARQFLGTMERPDVDKITGLSPVISIEQKTVNKNPRSTVGTITEIYDFLRLLYARIGEAFSYETEEKMVKYTTEKIIELIYEKYTNRKIYLLSPLIKGRKGHYADLFDLFFQIDLSCQPFI